MAVRRVPTGLGGLPIQIDYTARDFDEIRSELLELATQLSPQWTDKQPGDIGVTILEAVAYLGDILSYNIDRGVNESYLATAQTRSSVVNLLRLIGYELTPQKPSTVSMVVRTSQAVTLPEGFTVSVEGDDDLKYELLSQVVLPSAGIYAVSSQVTKTQNTFSGSVVSANDGLSFVSGESVSDIMVGTGLPDQTLYTTRDNVCDGVNGDPAIFVSINGTSWTPVESLLSYERDDEVYSYLFLNDGTVEVRFGDGVNGKSPSISDSIVLGYRVGGGEDTNRAGVGTITTFEPSITGVEAVINLTQPSGGADQESLESAKKYGPQSIRALDRCVTLEDFETIARKTSGVSVRGAKAIKGDSVVDVKLYVSVQGDDPTPSGEWFTQVNSGTLQLGTIGRFVAQRMPAPTRLIVIPATKVSAFLRATVYIFDTYLFQSVRDEIDTEVQLALSDLGDDFGSIIPLSKIDQVIENVAGVDFVDIHEMHRIPAFIVESGNVDVLQNSDVTFSEFGEGLVADQYRVTFLSPSTYIMKASSYGDIIDEFGTIKQFNVDADEQVIHYGQVSKPQFTLNITVSPTDPPSDGEVWTFSTDAYKSSINTESHEVIFAETGDLGNLDENFFQFTYIGGIGNGNA